MEVLIWEDMEDFFLEREEILEEVPKHCFFFLGGDKQLAQVLTFFIPIEILLISLLIFVQLFTVNSIFI